MEKDPDSRRLTVKNYLQIGGVMMLGSYLCIGVPLQVVADQAKRPETPEVTANPLTWLATPISNGIEAVRPSDLPEISPTPTSEKND